MKKYTDAQFARFPLYLSYFKELKKEGISFVSSPLIASKFGYSEEQVRKDFQVFSSVRGVNKRGRDIAVLIKDLENTLGYKHLTRGIVIGVGHLGGALLNYRNFDELGVNLVAGFDKKFKEPSASSDVPLLPLDLLDEKLKELDVEVAVITVPEQEAQEVIDKVISVGIKGILNFAHIGVSIPEGVALENASLASSFAILLHKLSILKEDQE